MLNPGSHLGRYEVVALLGAGGMGEVYLAHDATLRRSVATGHSDPRYDDAQVRLMTAASTTLETRKTTVRKSACGIRP